PSTTYLKRTDMDLAAMLRIAGDDRTLAADIVRLGQVDERARRSLSELADHVTRIGTRGEAGENVERLPAMATSFCEFAEFAGQRNALLDRVRRAGVNPATVLAAVKD